MYYDSIPIYYTLLPNLIIPNILYSLAKSGWREAGYVGSRVSPLLFGTPQEQPPTLELLSGLPFTASVVTPVTLIAACKLRSVEHIHAYGSLLVLAPGCSLHAALDHVMQCLRWHLVYCGELVTFTNQNTPNR